MTTKEDLPNARRAKYAIRFGRLIGSGSCRRVFRSKAPNRWIYKVDRTWPARSLGSNAMEYATYLEVKESITLPKGVEIPEMHLLGDILAAEYINGEHPKNWCSPGYGNVYHDDNCPGLDTCWATRLGNVRLNDLHPQNVVVTKDGTVYIVDIGHGLAN